MGFVDAVKTCLSKYATFQGRASRSEYWWFYLFFVLVVLLVLSPYLVIGFDENDPNLLPLIPAGLAMLALFLPSLAVAVRRLHDSNKSGWWYLITFVPYVGGIVLLIFLVLPGTKGENRFGPDPLG